jgi:hypothetical protein
MATDERAGTNPKALSFLNTGILAHTPHLAFYTPGFYYMVFDLAEVDNFGVVENYKNPNEFVSWCFGRLEIVDVGGLARPGGPRNRFKGQAAREPLKPTLS